MNLECLARARVEKPKKQRDTDALVPEPLMTITSGGGHDDGEAGEDGDVQIAGPTVKTSRVYPPIPWNFSTDEEMKSLLAFENRGRLTAFGKDLLSLPSMAKDVEFTRDAVQAKMLDQSGNYAQLRQLAAKRDRTEYEALIEDHAEKLKINVDEDNIEDAAPVPIPTTCILPNLPPDATFATQTVYEFPNQFISALVAQLPEDQKLTRDQLLFVAEFSQACDRAWEDQSKPPEKRRTHHSLLLGQGGSGKTHVIQKLVFDVVKFIWPPQTPDEPTLHVVAASNAQAKNISTKDVKARTVHNACCMRVQKLENARMRPGNKQKTLTRLWDKCMVLVIEEVSMVSAPLYNALDFRSMCGRHKTHDVSEYTYLRRGNAFGRIPIVIHLGDFFTTEAYGEHLLN